MTSVTDDTEYRFAYQEWDIMRERHAPPEEKLEKQPVVSQSQLTFAMQLQEARIRHRLTVQELAARCQLPVHAVTMYENGSEIPTTDVARHINRVLEIE